MSAPEKALDNAFQTLYNNLEQVVSYLDAIGRPSAGSVLRAFLWDPRQISDSTDYKKAIIHLQMAEEIIQTIKNTPLLWDVLNKKLKNLEWKEMWDQLGNFAFSHHVQLLERNAGAKDVGFQVLRLAEKVSEIVLTKA
jgi:hypothetical protein